MNEAATHDERIAHLADDYLARKKKGEAIELRSFLQDFPDLAEELADYINLLELMEGSRQSWPTVAAEPMKEKIGDFRLIRLVGKGGMGLVFEAVQESLGRTVALKLMKHSSRDRATLARFTREARAAARLHHTNIVAVYGVGVDQGEHYMALQFVPGISLDQLLLLLKRRGEGSTLKLQKRDSTVEGLITPPEGTPRPQEPAPEKVLTEKIIKEWTTLRQVNPLEYSRRVALLFAQVAEGLGHAHSHGILHRDIKPSNLMLDKEGVIWITDFGLARINKEEDLTATGQLVGTLRYLAPERLRKQESAQSDQYSLAATLYEVLTLQPVYDGQNSEELLLKISQETPLPPRRHVPGMPLDLQTIILKGLSRDPEQRYGTCNQMANDLRRFAEGQPISARRLGPITSVYRWAKRKPLTAGLVAAVFFSLLTGLIVSTTFYWQAEQGRKDAAISEGKAILAAREAAISETKALQAVKDAAVSENKAIQAAKDANQAKGMSDKVNHFFVHEVLALASPTRKGRNVTLLDALQTATGRVVAIFGTEPPLRASIHTHLGELYREIGQPRKAIEQHQQALDIRKAEFGEDSIDAMRSELNLALANLDLGELQKAEQLFRKLLPAFEKELGDNHENVLTIRNNLGVLLEQLGKFENALPFQRKAYEHVLKTNGPQDDLTLTAQNNLALLLVKLKKYDEALKLSEELIANLSQRFPSNHHRVLTARTNLITMAFQKGEYARAVPQAREILKAQQDTAGENDPESLKYMQNLGTLLSHTDLKEAEDVLKKTIEKMEVHLDAKHPNRLSAYHNLGTVYFKTKDYAKAEPLFLKSLEGRRLILPEQHPERLYTVIYLGQTKLALKDYEAANKYFEEALKVENKLTVVDRTMLIARRYNAKALMGLKKEPEAEKLLQENLKRLKTATASPDEWKLTREVLASLYEKQGKTSEAAELKK